MSTGTYTFVAGTTEVAAGAFLMFVSRYDAAGTLEQTVHFPMTGPRHPAQREAVKMAFASGGGDTSSVLAVTGRIPGLDGAWDIVTVVYDTPETNLQEKWYRVYSNGGCENEFPIDDQPVDIQFFGKDFVGVAGVSTGCATGTDMITLVYAVSDGTPRLEKRYTSPGFAHDDAVGLRFVGQTVITAGTLGLASGRAIGAVAYDYLATPATQLWATSYPIGGRHVDAAAMELHTDGFQGYYVAATATPFSPGGTNADIILAKFNTSDGQPAWTPNYIVYNNIGANGDDVAVAVDSCVWKSLVFPIESHVWAAGYTDKGGGDKDIVAFCYRDLGATFAERMIATADGQEEPVPGGDDRTVDMDAVGNTGQLDGSRAVITAQVQNLAGGFDILTIKFASTSAYVPHRITFPVSGSVSADLPAAVWTTGMHDWFTTGMSDGGASLFNAITVRYFDPNP